MPNVLINLFYVHPFVTMKFLQLIAWFLLLFRLGKKFLVCFFNAAFTELEPP